MPFYIFKIFPENGLEYIDEEEKYRAARDSLRTLRREAMSDDNTSYRMIFASTVAQGKTLLTSSARDDKIIGDD
jgi:hypothetical protein